MTEEKKGVVVSLAGTAGDRRHADADTVRIEDGGHLVVVRGGYTSTDVVAIYAPGKWVYGKVGL